MNLSVRRRPVQALLLLAAVAAIATPLALTGTDPPSVRRPPIPTGVGSIGNCSLPAQIAMPSWYPSDLPLPPGSFAADVETGQSGIRVVRVIVPQPLEATITYVSKTWAQRGWRMGQGEREQFEAENVFWKSDVRYGRYRINTLCSTEWTAVTLALVEPGFR